MGVAEHDDPGARASGAGEVGREARGGQPGAQHGDRAAGREKRAGKPVDARGQAGFEKFGRFGKSEGGEAIEAQPGFDAGEFGGGDVCGEFGDPAGERGGVVAPWGDVGKKHVAVGDPDAVVAQKKLGVVGDVGVVVAAEQGDGTAKRGEKSAGGLPGAVLIGHQGVSIEDEFVGVAEEGRECFETLEGAARVTEVKVGKDANARRGHGHMRRGEAAGGNDADGRRRMPGRIGSITPDRPAR